MIDRNKKLTEIYDNPTELPYVYDEEVQRVKQIYGSALDSIESFTTEKRSLLELARWFKSLGLSRFQSGINYLTHLEEVYVPLRNGRKRKTYNRVVSFDDRIFVLLDFKLSAIRQTDELSFEEEVELLEFWGYLPDNIKTPTVKNIEEAYASYASISHHNFVRDESGNFVRLPSSAIEKGSMIDLFKSYVEKNQKSNHDNKFEMKLGSRFELKDGGNTQAILLSFPTDRRKSTDVVFHIPIEKKGVVKIGKNTLVRRKSYIGNHSYLYRQIEKLVQDYLSLIRAYGVEHKKHYEAMFQQNITSLFFTKKEIYPTKRILDSRMEFIPENLTGKQIKAWLDKERRRLTFKWQPYQLISHEDSQETAFNLFIESNKRYFPEYDYASADLSDIDFTFKKDGFMNNPQFPMTKESRDTYDKSFVSTSGDAVLSKLESSITDKFHAAYMINPLYMLDDELRIALGTHTLTHAKELWGVPDKRLVYSPVGWERKEHLPPMYYRMVLFTEYESISDKRPITKGSVTVEDMVLYTPSSNARDGDKMALVSASKSKGLTIQDVLFFEENGVRHYIDIIASGESYISRNNPSSYVMGAFNLKRYLAGDNKVIVRDFFKEPPKEEELAGFKEIFRELDDGSVESLGFHKVGLTETYVLENMENSFSNTEDLDSLENYGYSTGLLDHQFIAKLQGLETFYNYLNDSKSEKALDDFLIYQRILDGKIAHDPRNKVGGKNGLATRLMYYSKVPVFYSQVLTTKNIQRDETIIQTTEEYFYKIINSIWWLSADDKMNAIVDFKEYGTYELHTLLTRYPSIDQAMGIAQKVIFLNAKDDPYFTDTLVLVNNEIWNLMGGDYDGDSASVIFLPYKVYKEVLSYWGPEVFKDRLDSIKHGWYKAKELGLLDYKKRYTDEESCLVFNEKIKGRKRNENYLKPKAYEEIDKELEYVLFTTRVSKTLIGFAKSATMKLTRALLTIAAHEGYKNKERYNTIIENIYKRNLQFVQPAISMQKWTRDLKAIKKLVYEVISYRQVVDLLVEPTITISNFTVNKVFDLFKEHKLTSSFKISDEAFTKIDNSINEHYPTTEDKEQHEKAVRYLVDKLFEKITPEHKELLKDFPFGEVFTFYINKNTKHIRLTPDNRRHKNTKLLLDGKYNIALDKIELASKYPDLNSFNILIDNETLI